MLYLKPLTHLSRPLTVAGLVLLATCAALGQIAPPRTLEELKEETQRRADYNLSPATGLNPSDVRKALANLHNLSPDDWARVWSAVGDRYNSRAKDDSARHDTKAEQRDYLMAWRYYSFARWPVPNSPGKKRAYQKDLAAFRAYAKFLDPPLEIVRIPYEGKQIVGYLRLPKGVRPAPMVLTISGLDSRKENVIQAGAPLLRDGVGLFAVDMPGTGEAPIKVDVGAIRMFSRILDYLDSRPEVDRRRIAVRGVSWSGYWAAKLAYVERARLRGAVVQGGPVADYFSPSWQKKALGTREYLFGLFDARSAVYHVKTLNAFLAYGPRMSLRREGFLGKPSAPMLLVNGAHDTQVPISDLYTLLRSGGSPKMAWINPNGGHTGRSTNWPNSRISREIIVPWIESQLARASAN